MVAAETEIFQLTNPDAPALAPKPQAPGSRNKKTVRTKSPDRDIKAAAARQLPALGPPSRGLHAVNMAFGGPELNPLALAA